MSGLSQKLTSTILACSLIAVNLACAGSVAHSESSLRSTAGQSEHILYLATAESLRVVHSVPDAGVLVETGEPIRPFPPSGSFAAALSPAPQTLFYWTQISRGRNAGEDTRLATFDITAPQSPSITSDSIAFPFGVESLSFDPGDGFVLVEPGETAHYDAVSRKFSDGQTFPAAASELMVLHPPRKLIVRIAWVNINASASLQIYSYDPDSSAITFLSSADTGVLFFPSAPAVSANSRYILYTSGTGFLYEHVLNPDTGAVGPQVRLAANLDRGTFLGADSFVGFTFGSPRDILVYEFDGTTGAILGVVDHISTPGLIRTLKPSSDGRTLYVVSGEPPNELSFLYAYRRNATGRLQLTGTLLLPGPVYNNDIALLELSH
jgi:hypothetical protein